MVQAEEDGNRAIDEAILNLRVTRPDRQAKILKVDYWAGLRHEAVTTLKAITDSYRNCLDDMYQKKSNETIALINKVKDKLSQELKDMEAKYLEYRRKAPYVVGDESGRSLMAQRLERSSVALKETEDNRRRLKFQLKLGERLAHEGMEMWAVAHAINQLGGDSTSLNSAINVGMAFSGTSDYVRQLISEQQQLAERFGPDNTKAQAIHEQVTRIQERTRDARGRLGQAEVKDLLTSISESLKAVDALHEDAVAEFAKERSEAKRIEIDMLTGSNLNIQVERHRALFNTVLDQLKQAQFVSDVTSITSMAVEPPYSLRKPTSPRIVRCWPPHCFSASCSVWARSLLWIGWINEFIRSRNFEQSSDCLCSRKLTLFGRSSWTTLKRSDCSATPSRSRCWPKDTVLSGRISTSCGGTAGFRSF